MNTLETPLQIGMMNVSPAILERNLHVLDVITVGVVIGRKKLWKRRRKKWIGIDYDRYWLKTKGT
jgi:hypothetical protein